MKNNSSSSNECISLFSGCGGSSLGYKQAGLNILLSNEFIPAAAEVYKLNFPKTILLPDDIRKITGKQILTKIGKDKGELELMDGSPPCSAFSMAVPYERNQSWDKIKDYSEGVKQRVDDLYFEYIRLLREIKPKVFLAENVPALTSGIARGYFNEIFREMQKSGYVVIASILDATNYLVPQIRKRLFFMGVREDIVRKTGVKPSFPKPLSFGNYLISVGKAWTGLRNTKADLAITPRARGETLTLLMRAKQGESLKLYHPKGHFYTHVRIHLQRPCPTILVVEQLYHPIENRLLSIPELRRVATFPDDFILTGRYAQQWERIGRAVPPRLMYYLAKHIKENILSQI